MAVENPRWEVREIPKTAEAKLTSEERCRKAFEVTYGFAVPNQELDGHVPTFRAINAMWHGWRACWRYLQEQAVKEFIEK